MIQQILNICVCAYISKRIVKPTDSGPTGKIIRPIPVEPVEHVVTITRLRNQSNRTTSKRPAVYGVTPGF